MQAFCNIRGFEPNAVRAHLPDGRELLLFLWARRGAGLGRDRGRGVERCSHC